MKPEAPEIHAAPDHRRLVIGGDDHHRHARILGAQIHAPEKAPPGTLVRQDQVDVGGTVEDRRHLVEGSGLGDVGPQTARHRLAQRPAKQWMIIGDHQVILCGLAQLSVQSARRDEAPTGHVAPSAQARARTARPLLHKRNTSPAKPKPVTPCGHGGGPAPAPSCDLSSC
jgi:hypothetical protein